MAKKKSPAQKSKAKRVAKLVAIPLSQAKDALELAKEVYAYMAAEPKRINLNFYVKQGQVLEDEPRFTCPTGKPKCGTVGCVAGWFAILTGETDDTKAESHVKDLLGDDIEYIDYAAGEDARFFDDGDSLFFHEDQYIDYNSYELKPKMKNIPLPGSEAYQKIVLKRVKRFITVNKVALKARKLQARVIPVED